MFVPWAGRRGQQGGNDRAWLGLHAAEAPPAGVLPKAFLGKQFPWQLSALKAKKN